MKRKEDQLEKVEKLNCAVCADLEDYYALCLEIVELTDLILRKGFFTNQNILRQLTPGRLVLFSQDRLRNCVGVILKASSDKSFDVIIPETKEADYFSSMDLKNENEKSLALFDLCFLRGQLAQPSGVDSKHTIKNISLNQISAISSKTIKISPDTIINDWQRRQQPRFR